MLLGIGGFHPIKNLAVDVVHDILEGICRYDLGLILHHYKTKKLYSLQKLNNLIKGFHYGSIKNKPTEILLSHIKAKHIIMSASAMLTLVVHLPMIIEHFIPDDDEIWQLILSLQKIVNIVMSYEIDKYRYQVLDTSITEYLQLLTTFFPNSLKPKHHFLVHYARIMLLCGPL